MSPKEFWQSNVTPSGALHGQSMSAAAVCLCCGHAPRGVCMTIDAGGRQLAASWQAQQSLQAPPSGEVVGRGAEGSGAHSAERAQGSRRKL